ncbi:hypothetical protein GLOIN_2v1779171 [Rhizophagus clarus]|uniref:Uncharacterized protein n=1 Tax=Rhizophagus clarus TaxID=94130 RepID=A0A8H3L2Z5_9GLOM|nr:hypothetical protein GLOIN_2v1779171 [Rhizophagus clarus]
MATSSQTPNDNTNNEPVKGSALIRLYKPAKIFPISFFLRHVRPYLSCDTRGAGTLFNTKKARYYFLSLAHLKETGIRTNNFMVVTNDTDLPGDHQRTFSSTSKSPTSISLSGISSHTFLTLIVNFPATSDNSNNRRTKTYIRFVYRVHVIYLGFYLSCNENCNLPAASVMSNKRWRCGEHYNEINACHKSDLHVPRISYDVVIKSFKKIPVRYRHNVPDFKKWKYFKEYKSLKFDILRSPQQIQRFNRLSALILKQNADTRIKKPFLLSSFYNYVFNGSIFQAVRVNVKNLRRKYKRKNKLPPLPPNFTGDAIAYYKSHHRISLDVPFIRNHYWRESLALAGINHCNQIISHIDTLMQCPEERVVQDVTPDHFDDDRIFVISPEDTALLASPNVFLHRIHTPPTPPPNLALKRLRVSQDRAIPIASTSLTSPSPPQSSTIVAQGSKRPNYNGSLLSDDVSFSDV